MKLTTDIFSALNRYANPVEPDPSGFIEISDSALFPFGMIGAPIRPNAVNITAGGAGANPTPTNPPTQSDTFGFVISSQDNGIIAAKSGWIQSLTKALWRLDYSIQFRAVLGGVATAGFYQLALKREGGDTFLLETLIPQTSAGSGLSWEKSILLALDQSDWHPYFLFTGNTNALDNTNFSWSMNFTRLT